jgi:hypothetical protein
MDAPSALGLSPDSLDSSSYKGQSCKTARVASARAKPRQALNKSMTNLNDARQKKNELEVKLNMEMHRSKKRKYPEVHVGDTIRIFKKKDKFNKERVPTWSKTKHTVERIDDDNTQDFYYVSGMTRPLMRNEILKLAA